MDYRIGKVEQNFGYRGHKFVITKNGDDFVYYAKIIGNLGELDFFDLINEHKLENIVCCGLIDHGAGGASCLGIWPGPLDLKPASYDLMVNFERLLFEEYRNFCPELKTVVNMCRRNEKAKFN